MRFTMKSTGKPNLPSLPISGDSLAVDCDTLQEFPTSGNARFSALRKSLQFHPFLFLLISPLLYYRLALLNLPVELSTDEGQNLGALLRLHTGALSPGYFVYPSLYFYLTHFLVFWCRPESLLQFSRTVSFVFFGFSAMVTYYFCVQVLRSRAAGYIAALMVLSSPLSLHTASTLRVDILQGGAATLGALWLSRYSVSPTFRVWLWTAVMAGLAVSCKYTAFSVFLAYVVLEVWNGLGELPERARVRRVALVASFSFASVALLLVYENFPLQFCMDFIHKYRSNPNVHALDDYQAFFAGIRRLVLKIGILLGITAVAIGGWRRVYHMCSPRRIYYGFAILVLVSILCTPFCLITPTKFAYDVGAMGRVIFFPQNDHPNWVNYVPNMRSQFFTSYFRYAISSEGTIFLLLGLIGFGLACSQQWRTHRGPLLFFSIHVILIGIAHIGYARYLVPVLPILFAYAAWVLVQLWNNENKRLWLRVLCVLLIVVGFLQVGKNLKGVMNLPGVPNALYQSYQVTAHLHPDHVYFAGYAPSVELRIAGFHVQEVGWAHLPVGNLGSMLGCNDVLILDDRNAIRRGVSTKNDRSVRMLLDMPDLGYDSYIGQQVLMKDDCPNTLGTSGHF